MHIASGLSTPAGSFTPPNGVVPMPSQESHATEPSFRRFEIAEPWRQEVELLSNLVGGLNQKYRERSRYQQARKEFFAKNAALVKAASDYFASNDYRYVPRELPSLGEQGTLLSGLAALLRAAPGLIIGEVHSSKNSKRFLIEHMAEFRRLGVMTLYLENLRSDVHQVLLDEYYASPSLTMPSALQEFLRMQDRVNGTDPEGKYTFYEVTRAAKQHGLRIIAIDCQAAFHLGGVQTVPGYYNVLTDNRSTLRMKTMNYFTSELIAYYQRQPGAGKWVALVGSAHANRYLDIPGLVDLTRAVSVRVDDKTQKGVPLEWDVATWSIRVDDGEIYTDNLSKRDANVYLRSDFILTPRVTTGAHYRAIERQLRDVGQFLICETPGFDELVLWHRTAFGELVPTVIERSENKYYFALDRPAWAAVISKTFPTLEALCQALSDYLGLRRADVALPRDELALAQASLSANVDRPIALTDPVLITAFVRARDARLLELSEFASAEDRAQFRLGRREYEARLSAFATNYPSLGHNDIGHYSISQLMQAYLDVQHAIKVADQGAIFQAIHHRQSTMLIREAMQWRHLMEIAGVTSTQLIVQNLYLAAAERRTGVCRAITAQLAALALHDISGDAVTHYLRKLSEAIELPDQSSARLMGLSLIEWSVKADAQLFEPFIHLQRQTLDKIYAFLLNADPSTAYELSVDQHAIVVGRVRRAGQLMFFLADPNYGYSEFASSDAFKRGLYITQQLAHALSGAKTTDARFTLRQYRAELAEQALLDNQRVDRQHPNILRVADLGHPDTLAMRFNGDAPLERDRVFNALQQRLKLIAYRTEMKVLQESLPGGPLTTLIEQILVKHGEPVGVLTQNGQPFALRFEGKDALVVLSRDSELSQTRRIDGSRFAEDVARLRQCQKFFDAVASVTVTRSFLSRLFRLGSAGDTLSLDSLFLTHALPLEGLIHPLDIATIETSLDSMQHVPVESLVETTRLDDVQLAHCTALQEAQHHGAALKNALHDMWPETERTRWVPLLDSVSRLASGQYRLGFIDKTQPENVVYQKTRDQRFQTFVDYLARLRARLSGRTPSDPTGLDGLNSAFAIQALLRSFYGEDREGTTEAGVSHSLALALRIHDAVYKAQIVQGVLQDAEQLLSVARAVVRGEQTSLGIADSLLEASRSALMGVGGLLQAFGLILDVSELAQATNEAQRTNFATHLAFDSAGLGLMGASLLGVEAAGPLGSVVAGLGIGVTALVGAYEEIAQKAAGIGSYLASLYAAYTTATQSQSGAYRYDETHQALLPVSPAVLDTIDLRARCVRYASPQLYRTHHGATGSGAINYFFWAGDAPQLVHDRRQAIDVRERLAIAVQALLPTAGSEARTLVLPGVPQAYLSYRYNTLPGATLRNDAGFALWRQLEQKRDFDFDYYTFPSEYIIDTLTPEFVNTKVRVFLDTKVQRVELPVLAPEQQGYLQYVLTGGASRYVLGLAPGVSVNLQSDNARGTEWVLDARGQGTVSVEFGGLGVKVAGTRVNLGEGVASQPILLLKDGGEVWRLDVAQQQAMLVELDATQWAGSDAALKDKIVKLLAAASTHDYVRIRDYPVGTEAGKLIKSTVYYEVKRQRYLYAQHYPEAVLAAVSGEVAYFYNREQGPNKVLRVDAGSGKVMNGYQARQEQDTLTVWQERGVVLMATRTRAGASAVYAMDGSTLVLLKLRADSALSACLGQWNRQPEGELAALLRPYAQGVESVNFVSAPQSARLPGIGAVLVIDVASGDTLTQRYWWRVGEDRLLALKGENAGPQGLAWDLNWVGSLTDEDGARVDYFYSAQRQQVYRQATDRKAELLNLTGISQLNIMGGALYVTTQTGLVQQLAADGGTVLVGVTLAWMKAAGGWAALRRLAGERTVAVLDVKASNGQNQGVWLSGGHAVVAGHALGAQLEWLGLNPEGDQAWLFDRASGKLYTQAVLGSETESAVWQVWTQQSVAKPVVLPEAQCAGNFTGLTIVGQTLSLIARAPIGAVPRITGCDQLLYTVPAGSELEIDAHVWRHYRRIVVQRDVGSGARDATRLVLALENPLALQVEKVVGVWHVLDRSTGRALQIYGTLQAEDAEDIQEAGFVVSLRRYGGSTDGVDLGELLWSKQTEDTTEMQDLFDSPVLISDPALRAENTAVPAVVAPLVQNEVSNSLQAESEVGVRGQAREGMQTAARAVEPAPAATDPSSLPQLVQAMNTELTRTHMPILAEAGQLGVMGVPVQNIATPN